MQTDGLPTDPFIRLARSGILQRTELAFWWVMIFYGSHQCWPKVDCIAPGVWHDYQQRINRSAAYRGLRRARRAQARIQMLPLK